MGLFFDAGIERRKTGGEIDLAKCYRRGLGSAQS